MGAQFIDIALWLSRRLRYAVLALLAVGAVKTAAAALDEPEPAPGSGTVITTSDGVVSQ
jgi:hypothetical protein